MKQSIVTLLSIFSINAFAVANSWNIHNTSKSITFKRMESHFKVPNDSNIDPIQGTLTATDASFTPILKQRIILSDNRYLIVTSTTISFHDADGNILAKCDYLGQNCNSSSNFSYVNPGVFNFEPT